MLMFHISDQLSCSGSDTAGWTNDNFFGFLTGNILLPPFSDGTSVHIHSTLKLVQSLNWSVSEFLRERASTILSWTTGSFKSPFNFFSGFNDRSLPSHPLTNGWQPWKKQLYATKLLQLKWIGRSSMSKAKRHDFVSIHHCSNCQHLFMNVAIFTVCKALSFHHLLKRTNILCSDIINISS